MKNLKRFRSSIVLLILGLLIANTQVVIGDGCQGMMGFLAFCFFGVIYTAILIVVVILSANKYYTKKEPFNYYPIITTGVVAILVYFAVNADKYESSTAIYAQAKNQRMRFGSSLTLRKNETFKITMQEIEWACYYKGDYKIANDTLLLSRNDIPNRTDTVFTNKYLIDKGKGFLFPLDRKGALVQDTTKWLTITNEDKD
jgi:hypothetical protein